MGPFAGAIRTAAVVAAFRPPELVVSQSRQMVYTILRHNDDTATATAVTTIRAAVGHVLFAPEANATVASLATLNFNLYAINKHHSDSHRDVANKHKLFARLQIVVHKQTKDALSQCQERPCNLARKPSSKSASWPMRQQLQRC